MFSDRSRRAPCARAASTKRARFHLVVLSSLLALFAMPGIASGWAKERRDGATKVESEQILRGEAKPAPQFAKDLATLAGTLARYAAPKSDAPR